MDEMTITGKDGKPRYQVKDKVTNLVDVNREPCMCGTPDPTTVRTDEANVKVCQNCGHQILTDTTSQEKI